MQKKISIFSFFSGIGILDLAFEKNGYNIVFVNEYDNLFIESYRYARMQMNLRAPIYGYRNDSAERYARRRGKKNLLALIAQEREKGNLVGFIGGPPCPDFSVAGKNAGVDGENGRLTKIYFDIICRCHPDFFLFEKAFVLVTAIFAAKMSVRTNGCTPSLIMTFCQCLVSTGLMIQVNSDVGKIFCRVCFNDQR